MSLFRNPRPVLYVIGLFVLFLLILWSRESRSEELEFEAGAAIVRGETAAIGVTISCKECGPVKTDYEFGFDLIGSSNWRGDNPNNIQLRAQLVDGWGRVEAGLGFYWHNTEQQYNCDFGFHLLLRYRVTERISVQARHSSSAGSCYPNAGRDLLTIGWRF